MFYLYITHSEHQRRAAKNNVLLVYRGCFHLLHILDISREAERVALLRDVVRRTRHQHDTAFRDANLDPEEMPSPKCTIVFHPQLFKRLLVVPGGLYHQISPAMTFDITSDFGPYQYRFARSPVSSKVMRLFR